MRPIVIAGLFAVLGTTALAADNAAPGRYTLTPSGNGYVRLDTQTGQVSECTGVPSNLVCKSSPDERAALQTEIDRLQKQVDNLKADTPPEATANQSPELNLPSDKEVDKAFSFMERVVKRFKGLIEEMHKDSPDSTPL